MSESLASKEAVEILLAGCGYIYLRSASKEIVRELLIASPMKLEWGTVWMQTWVEGFDLNEPNRFKVLTWVTIKRISLSRSITGCTPLLRALAKSSALMTTTLRVRTLVSA